MKTVVNKPFERSAGGWQINIKFHKADGTIKTSSKSAPTEDAAWALYHELAKDAARDTLLPADKVTLVDYIVRHIAQNKKHGLRRSSEDKYLWALNTHIVPHFGALRLQEVTTDALQDLFDDLVSEKELKGSSVRLIRVPLAAALKEAFQKRLIASNPMVGVKMQKAAEVALYKKAIEPWDLERLIGAIADHPYRDLVMFALGTGVRRGEALGLWWDQIDWNAAEIRITHQLVQHDDGSVERTPPKTALSERTVSLPVETLALLRERHRAATRLAAETGQPLDPYVFGTVVPKYLSAWFIRTAREAGFESSFHCLRHTFITRSVEGITNQDELKNLSTMVGHKSVWFTIQKYQTPSKGGRDRVAATASAVLPLGGTSRTVVAIPRTSRV
jgi:integrase